MRWFRPIVSCQVTDDDAVDRFGGAPRGRDVDVPACGSCGAPLAPLARLHHHAERLPLGGAGRRLTIWWCASPAGCDTWDPEAGATAVIVEVGASRQGGTATDHAFPETIVTEWIEGDDGVAPEDLALFSSVRGFRALRDADARAAVPGTHLGGAPFWVHSPDEAPPPPYAFALQLDPRDLWPDGSGPELHGGLAYIFLDRTVDPPAGVLIWQS